MPDAFVTVAEIAELLKVNPQTVRNWIDRRELPAVRVGRRRVRVRQADLDEFLEAVAPVGVPEGTPSAASGEAAGLWAQLGEALSTSIEAISDVDRAELVRALNAVAQAASQLAAILASRARIENPSDDLDERR